MIYHADTLVEAYELLATMKPCRGWRLPHSDEIAFEVTKYQTKHGQYVWESGKHTIQISADTGHTATMLATMAHEMIHLRQVLLGRDPDHGADFKRMAALMCKHHGFDPATF